jgi:hypothetical protein
LTVLGSGVPHSRIAMRRGREGILRREEIEMEIEGEM